MAQITLHAFGKGKENLSIAIGEENWDILSINFGGKTLDHKHTTIKLCAVYFQMFVSNTPLFGSIKLRSKTGKEQVCILSFPERPTLSQDVDLDYELSSFSHSPGLIKMQLVEREPSSQKRDCLAPTELPGLSDNDTTSDGAPGLSDATSQESPGPQGEAQYNAWRKHLLKQIATLPPAFQKPEVLKMLGGLIRSCHQFGVDTTLDLIRQLATGVEAPNSGKGIYEGFRRARMELLPPPATPAQSAASPRNASAGLPRRRVIKKWPIDPRADDPFTDDSLAAVERTTMKVKKAQKASEAEKLSAQNALLRAAGIFGIDVEIEPEALTRAVAEHEALEATGQFELQLKSERAVAQLQERAREATHSFFAPGRTATLQPPAAPAPTTQPPSANQEKEPGEGKPAAAPNGRG